MKSPPLLPFPHFHCTKPRIVITAISIMIFGSGLLAGLLLIGNARAIRLPDTRMDFKVSITHKAFYDPSRADSQGGKADRPMMATLYFPIYKDTCSKLCQAEYMPTDTARAMDGMFFSNENINVFGNFDTTVCCGVNQALRPDNHTIVVLEPGVGTTRFLYGAMAKEIASQGHAVIVLDHPYDNDVMNPPLSPFDPITSWNSTVEDLVESRARDINFVVSQVSDLAVAKDFLSGFDVATAFNTDEVAFLGQGLGGTVATHMVTSGDPRYHVSINMGGSAPNLTSDTYSSIVFFGRSSYRRDNDPLWSAAWKHLRGPATEYDMDDAGFMQYSDLPLIAELGGRADKDGMIRSGVKGLGPLFGTRSWQCASYLARVYLTMYLRSRWTEPNETSRELADLVQFYSEMKPWEPRN